MKHFLLAFLLAVICYAFFYHNIENRRTRKGPWQVTFTNDFNGNPALIVNQPKLAITNVEIVLSDQKVQSVLIPATILFGQPQPVPYSLPLGRCVFMDTTFLPGTVSLEVFNHEIELLPRVLVIDRQEHPWLSQSIITLHPVSPGQAAPVAPKPE